MSCDIISALVEYLMCFKILLNKFANRSVWVVTARQSKFANLVHTFTLYYSSRSRTEFEILEIHLSLYTKMNIISLPTHQLIITQLLPNKIYTNKQITLLAILQRMNIMHNHKKGKSAIIKIICYNLQLSMTTPLKLKRDDDAFIKSTMDRSFIDRSQAVPPFANIAPSYYREELHRNKHDGLKQETRITITVSEYESTTELETKITQIIQRDDELSQRNTDRSYRGHFYTQKHNKGKIAKGWRFQFPSKVYQLYGEPSCSLINKVNFSHGCLGNCGIYYFCIQNRVLFYDITAAIHSLKKLEECFLNEMVFETTVFELKQLDWKSPLIKEFGNKRLIAVLQPWSLSLMMVQIQSFSEKILAPKMRWLRATMLNFSCHIQQRKMENLVANGQNMFYMNQKGGINHISSEKTNWIRKVLTGRNHRLANYAKSIGLTTNHFYVSRKIGFFQKIKHYSKIISTEVKNIIGRHTKNIGLCFDEKRNLLFSLVDTHPKDQTGLSYSKILTCWAFIDGKLIQKCKISQVEFYCTQLEQLLSQHDNANCRISKIFTVQQSFYPESNLLIVLECGLRLYMKVANRFQILSLHHINSLQNQRRHSGKNVARQSDLLKPLSLVHCISQGSLTVMTLKDINHHMTYAIWKKNQDKQDEFSSKLVWGSNMKDDQQGKRPIQSQLFKCNPQTFARKKWKMVAAQLQLNQYASKYNIFLHQISRDMYVLPEIYIHSTQSYIQYFFMMRPVDILVTALLAEIKQQSIIRKIMPEFSRKELMFMLVQIFCDMEGLYVKDMDFLQIMVSYANKQAKQTPQNTNFQDYCREYEVKLVDPYASKKKRLKSNSANFQSRQVIDKDMQVAILQLLFKFSQNQQKNHKFNQVNNIQSIHQNIFTSILEYAARLLRFIWKKNMSAISKQSFCLTQEIESLKKLIDKVVIFDNRSRVDLCSAKETKHRLKRITVKQTDLSFDSKTTQNQKNVIRAKTIRQFMDKIQQLILMSVSIEISIPKTFQDAVGMEPTYYQEYLFNYLVLNCNNTIKIFEKFKQMFPLFIGKNIQKSLKIENQTRHMSIKQILETLRYHKNVPKYLLNSIKCTKHLRSSQLAQFCKQISTSKISFALNSTPRQNISALLKKLQDQFVPLFQRTVIIRSLKMQIMKYLESKKGCEDVFYISSKRDMLKIEKKIAIQQLVLEAYKEKYVHLTDSTVLQQLQRTLLPVEEIENSIKLLNQNIYIVYLYMFTDIDEQRNNKKIAAIFQKIFSQQCYQRSQETLQNWKERIKFWEKKKMPVAWSHLQTTLNFVIRHCKRYIAYETFMDTVIKSFLSEQIINNFIGNDCFENALRSLELSDREAEISLMQWRQKIKFPILSFNFLQCGLDEQDQINQFYSVWLRKVSEEAMNLSIIDRNIIIYNWLCYFCFLLSLKRSLAVFANRSYDLIKKLRRSRIVTVDDTKKMKELILTGVNLEGTTNVNLALFNQL